ncbi:tryptophan halogenase family protein [Asticcacaulis sp.]|uniref:tryptophan halogenase family protein n=1 Tax=Asticcacaulis sp. TaxID=1872648 RepID=UPI003F7B6869
MNNLVRDIVIVGGGTAGWLSACVLAASAAPGLTVTLIESPDVPTIGVGEGTWPTIRHTLARIGIGEAEFLLACDASFKQGSRFDGWRDGAPADHYYHPFVPPPESVSGDCVTLWRDKGASHSFADFVGPQPGICALNLAPRQRAMPDYAGALNYAYHLDAGKLARLLTRHATQALGVRHISDHVTQVTMADNGDVAAVQTRTHGAISGDLFIDCTGHAARLIDGCYGVPLIDRQSELFNDRALAVQVPVAPGSPIASQTTATAHAAGWTWDIGLPTRRGIGCVYSSAYMSDDEAETTLDAYLRARTATALDAVSPRLLSFRSGHRERFWERNCLAIGQAAGFLEPLEASAIVMIELSLDALVKNFPRDRSAMDVQARRFNTLFRYRWDRIVEFLKLHYIVNRREEPYWRAHREAAGIPARLADLLEVWKHQPPSNFDFPQVDEVFPAASYQYVLYGMGFPPPEAGRMKAGDSGAAEQAIRQATARARGLAAGLPTNRAYLDALREATMPATLTQDLKG